MNQKESPDRPEAPVRLHWPGKDSDDVPLPAAVDGKLVEVTALSAGFKDSGNVIVHGDNLAVMKLMEPSLKGTVDCIYTDPPYNTRSRFRFYSDDMGHSDWLAAIRDRLECMQTLLANDGSIWVSADDNECHYLKVLMDEVFGRANFITNIIWKKHYLPDLSARHFSVEHDHILVYARDASRWTLEGNRDGADTDSDRPPTIWDHTEVGHTTEARQEVVALFDGDVFETPKPERLIKRILELATRPGDLVLDAYLGSGTTAAVAMKMGRRFIGIEKGEHAIDRCYPRLNKVVAGEQGGISADVNWIGGSGFRFFRLERGQVERI